MDARPRVRRQARADARSLSIRIAIAQCAPALGAVRRNVDMHMSWIARAKAAGARLVIFPELSLTGYYLKDLAADVACPADDPQLAPIAKASVDLDISAGFVERSADAKLHIAQGHWSRGKLVNVHRKVYLPTYGIFDDGRYFGPGDRFDTYSWAGGTTGVAICEDLWHVSTPYLYAAAGATIVLCPSSAVTNVLARTGVIRPDPKDPSPLRIDEVLVRKMLVLFIRDETAKARLRRAVVGVSGGVDSAVTAALASEALGAKNVLGLFTPYRISSPDSRAHAREVSLKFGFTLEEVPI